MKQFAAILFLLIGTLLFLSTKENNKLYFHDSVQTFHENQLKQQTSDYQYHLQILSNDLKDRQAVTPRRVVRSFNYNCENNSFKSIERFFHSLLLKHKADAGKVMQKSSNNCSLFINSLFFGKKNHIFTFRKLII